MLTENQQENKTEKKEENLDKKEENLEKKEENLHPSDNGNENEPPKAEKKVTPSEPSQNEGDSRGAATTEKAVLSELTTASESRDNLPYIPEVNFCAIGFHHKQFMSVTNADDDIIDMVIRALKFHYCKGIRKKYFQDEPGTRRLELYGMPFQPYFMDHFTFVYAMSEMMKDLLKFGSSVVAVPNLGLGRDMFLWVLRKQKLKRRIKEHQFGTLELLGRCKFRVYGAVQDVIKDIEEIFTTSGNAIMESEAKYSLFTTLRLENNIWDSKRSNETIKSKIILTQILQKLENLGFKCYTAVPLDRKRSTVVFWRSEDSKPPQKPSFMVSLMRKNRIVVSGAEEHVLKKIKYSLEKNWRRVVQEESLMNDHDEDNCQTFILDQNPWCESSAEQFRRTLDLFLHFFETLRFEGWRPCVNLHMITNNIDRSTIWFEHMEFKQVEMCTLCVENQNRLRAYKVPPATVESLGLAVLDFVIPTSEGWTSAEEGKECQEYCWEFEDCVWVSPSSQKWKEAGNSIERGHGLLGALFNCMFNHRYHSIIALNLPPQLIRENEADEATKNLCTFFFGKDDPHPNNEVYPPAEAEIVEEPDR